MAYENRYVAYSPSKGIFLGPKNNDAHEKVVWSKDQNVGLTGQEQAPTFTDKADLLKYINEALVPEERAAWPNDVELHLVFPADKKYMLADREACSNAGLPRWGVGQ